PELCPAHTAVFQFMVKLECYFINGMEKVRFFSRLFYNAMEAVRFDSDVGWYEGFTPAGERVAQYNNNNPEWMERKRTAVGWYCRHNYEVLASFLVERRVTPLLSQSIPVH
ncbi:2B1G protein, partial [Catharus fuscescens]|nr:2B1G protein [Catharus fuscescens]